MEAVSEPPPPTAGDVCRAVIDVGTNSVKLLVGRVCDGSVVPLYERGEQTRLGAGFYREHRLDPAAIERTTTAVRAFLHTARRFEPASVRTIATAAAREAVNREELLEAIRKDCGVELEVIEGEVEAAMAFRGVSSDPRFAGMPLLVTDLGGGSTEFILGNSGRIQFSRSFPMGAVRLFEMLQLPGHPARTDLAGCRAILQAFLTTEVLPALQSAGYPPDAPSRPTYVAVGGTALILARLCHAMEGFDRDRLDATDLRTTELTALTEKMWSMSLEDRRRLPGLPEERADIVLTGSVIHEGILRRLGLLSLRPSTRGLRFAALLPEVRADDSGAGRDPGERA